MLIVKTVVAALACFGLFLVAQVLVLRAWQPRERFRTIVWVFLALVPAYLALWVALPDALLAPLLALPAAAYYLAVGGLLYLLLFFGYCSFYFIIDRSMSLRIPMEIEATPGAGLTAAELKAAYDLDDYLQRRLDHLCYGGYLACSDGKYTLTSRGRAAARLGRRVKSLLKLGRGG